VPIGVGPHTDWRGPTTPIGAADYTRLARPDHAN